LSLQLTKI